MVLDGLLKNTKRELNRYLKEHREEFVKEKK